MNRSSIFLCLLVGTLLVLILGSSSAAQAQSGSHLDWLVRQLSDGTEEAETPTILADDSGRIHIFWDQISSDGSVSASGLGAAPGTILGNVQSTYGTTRTIFYARNEGGRWSIGDIVNGDVASPYAAIDSHGVLYLLWVEKDSLRLSYAPSATATSAWSWAKPTTIATGSIYNPIIQFDSKDVMHVAYSVIARPSAVYYLHSKDSGQTWSQPVIFESARQDAAAFKPQIALGEDGSVHLVWSLIPTSVYYGGLGVYYARSTNGGDTWSAPERIDKKASAMDSGVGAWNASIATIRGQEVHVVWDSHASAGNRFHQWSRDGGLTWSEPDRVFGAMVAQTGPNAMAVDSGGMLYVFASGTFNWNQPLGVYQSHWLGGKWSDPEVVDLSSAEPHWLQAAVLLGNTVNLVWEARAQKPRAVWYASASTSAPRSSPRPYNTIKVTPTLPVVSTSTLAMSSPTTQISATRGSLQTQFKGSVQFDPVSVDPTGTILVGTLPAVLLVGLLLLFRVGRYVGGRG